MVKYIALLRGINVSGQKIIKMADLQNLFKSLNFSNVRTYIQSGNIVFKTSIKSKSTIKTKIEEAIKNSYNFSVNTLIKQKEEIEDIITKDPFRKIKDLDYSKVYVTFLHSFPEKSLIELLAEYKSKNDKFIIMDEQIYLYCPDGFGRTKFTNNFFENKLKISATTRNWKTINKLVEITNEI